MAKSTKPRSTRSKAAPGKPAVDNSEAGKSVDDQFEAHNPDAGTKAETTIEGGEPVSADAGQLASASDEPTAEAVAVDQADGSESSETPVEALQDASSDVVSDNDVSAHTTPDMATPDTDAQDNDTSDADGPDNAALDPAEPVDPVTARAESAPPADMPDPEPASEAQAGRDSPTGESATDLVPVKQARISTGPGFFTMLLGGLIAGGIGYGLSTYDVFEQRDDGRLAGIESRLNDQSGSIEELAAQSTLAAETANSAAETATAAAQSVEASASASDLAELRALIETSQGAGSAPVTSPTTPPADGSGAGTDDGPALGDLVARVDTVAGQVDTVADRIEALTGQIDTTGASLADLTTRFESFTDQIDPEAAQKAMDAYTQQLATLQSQLDDQRDDIAVARDAAETETRRISVQAALAKIGAALENGDPFVDALAELDTTGGPEAPEGLTANASGVATLSQLQDQFPPAARRALNLSIREISGGGTMNRIGDFLRAQTGARSLGAKDGDDPDAILSRAEAAVKSGDLPAALTEIAALPPSGQEAMADWRTAAEARLAATTAHADLAAQNSN